MTADTPVGGTPLELPPEATSAGRARRYVRDCLLAIAQPELVECAVLGVDELVANVCIHAHTPLVLSVVDNPDHRVRIEVTDYADKLPLRQQAQALDVSGRGLTLLDACGTWGIAAARNDGGKTIWFEPSATMQG